MKQIQYESPSWEWSTRLILDLRHARSLCCGRSHCSREENKTKIRGGQNLRADLSSRHDRTSPRLRYTGPLSVARQYLRECDATCAFYSRCCLSCRAKAEIAQTAGRHSPMIIKRSMSRIFAAATAWRTEVVCTHGSFSGGAAIELSGGRSTYT